MSPNTIGAYRNDLQQFTTWLEGERIASVLAIDLGVLAGFVESLHARQLKATTIARRLVAIKMFFRFLVLEGVLTESAVDLLSSPKLWRYLPTVLSPEMVDRLLEAPGWSDSFPLRDRAVLTVLYATGCRASEVSGLRLTDVRLEENFCRCLGKGNKERIVSLNPVAVKAIREYLSRERPKLSRFRESEFWLFIISIIVSIGMWLERFVIIVTSIQRDFLPSSWAMYSPTIWDWSMFIGTLGFFLCLFFLFIRFLPIISIFEVRTLLPQANVHGRPQDFDENVLEIEYTYDKTDPPNR